jgi:hypothetical protein
MSQMLLNMRSILSGKLYLQFEMQMCMCHLPCSELCVPGTEGYLGGRTSNLGRGVEACLVCKHVAGLLGQEIGPSQGLHLHRAAQK